MAEQSGERRVTEEVAAELVLFARLEDREHLGREHLADEVSIAHRRRHGRPARPGADPGAGARRVILA